MRKILSVLMLFAFSFTINAQAVMTFNKEQNAFLKDLNFFMTGSKMEPAINATTAFEKMAKEGKIPATWYEKMAKTCNVMSERSMSASMHFVPYLEAVMAAAKSAQTDAQFFAWSQFVEDIIDGQKKGDNSGFIKTMDFSTGFFEQGALHITQGKTWKVDSKDYKFDSEGLRPHVSFNATNLFGMLKGDTVVISQTSGDYYPLESKWEGKSGRVDWARAGLDPGKVYCTFKNYSVNTQNYNYTVDTVTFYHSEYFKTPLRGKLIDKMVSSSDSASMSYPRFESYDLGITVKDIAPNVSYVGGFSLNGNKVLGYGTSDVKASLDFYSRDGKTKVLSAKSSSITIKKGIELGAVKAEVAIYFGTDSIYHPQLSLVYKIPKREMRLLRGETGIGKSKFTDSYHRHEFQTDAIFWNMDSSILNLKILSGVGEKPGVYESENYFNKELIRQTQGYTSYEPLSILKKLVEQNGGSRDLNAIEVARAINPNLKEGEVKSLFYQLLESGFILYNEDLGIVTVKDKTMNYVLANIKKIDYDVIRIKSNPKKGNDFIDLQNHNIDLKGVFEIPISDTAYVFFRPKDNAVSLQKDRNMEFDGLIYAGRTDLTGQKYKFNYKPFTVDLTKVDTMVLYIPDSANTLDRNGNPVLVQMKSRIENITGSLEIDAPINKAGRTHLLQFPKLHSNEKSNIYYDDPAIAKGAYTRKNFFFELEPFRLDSLGVFSPGMVNWPGKLASGGIFPDIKDKISIQKDLSLGFKAETPPDGYPLYGGKGQYYGKFELNYSGLQGDARITHSTADFVTHDVRLYPDSMRATTDTFRIAKTFEGVKTPAVVGTSDMIFWKPTSDTMLISMLKKEQPFAMYDDGFTAFKGNLVLTNKGLGGDGTLDWNEATLSSKNFSFRTMALSADTAALNIKTTGDRVTFKTPNVSAKVDFETRVGDFVSNEKNIPTDFSWNKYSTAINQFKWFMDEKILDFKSPQGEGEYFTSTKAEQKGLKFLGKRAIYYLVTSLLRIEQVPEIRVADASVIPDSGIVIIEEDAKMNQLRNAVIIADTIHKLHRIENAVVDIYSKNELKAIGDYHYNTKDIKEIINFGDISCKRETEGKKRKEQEFYQLTAKANLDESKNFIIYPDVHFNGEATLLSVNPFMNFKGYAKIDLKHPKAATTDFFINQDVDPNTLALQYDTTAKSNTGNHLSTGIYLNPSPDAPAMYTTLMAPKQEARDIALFKSTGIITQTATGEYLFGDSNKMKSSTAEGNLLRYDDKKGTVKAEGKFNFGLNFGIIKTLAAGSAEGKLDSNKYKFNFTFGIDLKMESKMQERFDFYMTGDNADQPDISYENDKLKQPIRDISDAKDDKKLLEEFDKTGAFIKRPKDLDQNLVFTDVNFVYDPDDISLRSVGKIGLAMSGKKVINKKLDGYIEYQYKGGTDVFTIYLETGTKGWFYFEYRPGQLGIVSSYDDINNAITAIAPIKRKISGSNNRFYMYTLGSSLNKEDFIQYMKDKASGVVRPRPEPRVELPPIIEDTIALDSLGNPIIPIDSITGRAKETPVVIPVTAPPATDRRKGKKAKAKEEAPAEEAAPAPSEMQIDDRARQQQLMEMEQLKKQGDGILSGPPPGRDKPKEEPKPEIIEPKEEVAPPKEEPKPEIIAPREEPKAEPVPETPKQEIVAPKEEIKPEAPKQEAAPPKEEPKPETPKEEVKPEDEYAPGTIVEQAPAEKKSKKKGKKKAEEEKETAPVEEQVTPPQDVPAPPPATTDSIPK